MQVLAAKVRSQELSDKKTVDEISLNNLATQIDVTAKRQAELSPKCAALLSEVTTLQGKFMKDVAIFLSDASWENVGTELSLLHGNTRTAVEEMTVQKSAEDQAFVELREDWKKSSEKQTEFKGACVALTSTVSTLVDRFLKDLGEFFPAVTWNSAGAELSALLGETANQVSELTIRKGIDETALAKLKTAWDTAKKNQTDGNTELAKTKTRKDEREIYAQESNRQHAETKELFASAVRENGFENETEYSTFLLQKMNLQP